MTNAYGEVTRLNAELVAISTDDLGGAADMAAYTDAPFPIAADADKAIARSYGVFNLLGDGVATPATFIVGSDGTIDWLRIGKTAGDRVLPAELLPRLREAVR